jgi:hypothetical protein
MVGRDMREGERVDGRERYERGVMVGRDMREG